MSTETAVARLIAIPGVTAAYPSVRPTGDPSNLEPVIAVYGDVDPGQLPSDIDGIPVEPGWSTPTCPLSGPGGARFDHLVGGTQIGPTPFNFGTLGCIVSATYGARYQTCLLTAAHVMARPDHSHFEICYQPASNSTSDLAGKLFRFSPAGDALLCSVGTEAFPRPSVSGVNGITQSLQANPVEPTSHMKVQKMGQKTGRTYGVIIGITFEGFIVEPDPDFMPAGKPVACAGDSGAVWVTQVGSEFAVVGLLSSGFYEPPAKNYAVGLKASLIAGWLNIHSFNGP